MSNRVLNIIEQIEREAEHKRQMERVQRSAEVYAAAFNEALQQGVKLTANSGSFTIANCSRIVWFYPATNVVMAQGIDEPRAHQVEVNAEVDVFDVLLLFCEGKFQ